MWKMINSSEKAYVKYGVTLALNIIAEHSTGVRKGMEGMKATAKPKMVNALKELDAVQVKIEALLEPDKILTVNEQVLRSI